MISWLHKRWDHFWFLEISPLPLGLLRIIFFASLFFRYLNRDFAYLAHVSAEFWRPIPLFEILSFTPQKLSLSLLHGLQVAWKVMLLLSAIGVWTQLSTAASLAVGFFLLGLDHSFVGTTHSTGLILCMLAVFTFSRCGDAFSFDRLLTSRKAPSRFDEYFWPVQLCRALHALTYFAAALSKLRHSGVEWVASDSLSILIKQYHALSPWLSPLGLWVAERPLIYRSLALFTLAIEFIFPLALFSRRIRPWLLGAMLCVHVGIYFTLGIRFWVFAIPFLFWLPVERSCVKERPHSALK